MVKEYGYEYDATRNETLWSETKGKCTSDKLWGAHCLRSGRDALKAIAREYAPRTAMIPALACDSMIRPFEQYGHHVKYYKLRKDYSIDLDSIASVNEPMLFLYMDYFGKKAISDAELEWLRQHKNIVFIEDRTHNLNCNRTVSFRPDYTIASLRKWLPIPDGGLLWGEISKPLMEELSFSTLRLKAQCMRHEFLVCGNEEIKAEYRKIFSTVSDIMDQDEPSAISAYSYCIAHNTDFGMIKTIRKQNATVLISKLKESPNIKLIQDTPGISDLYVAFTVPKRDEVQEILSAEGIFNTIIWPLTTTQKHVCDIARFTEENMLAAPCDQRYTTSDMEYIGSEILRVVENVNR